MDSRALLANFNRAIKRFALLLTASIALQTVAQAATVTILPSPPGAKRSASEGLAGYTTENFDSFSTGSIANGNTGSSAIGNWLATGSGISVGDGSGNAILDNKFIGTGTNSSVTFTLTTPSRYIGFYSIWVSGGNTWTFYDSSNSVIATLDSSSMVNLVGTKAQNKSVLASDGQTYGGASYYATGQTEPSFYVNLQLDDPNLYFTKVVFSNRSSGGNEFDNVTTSATYIPPLYTVSGSVSGLGSGKSVVLLNNGGNSTTVNANGSFTVSTAISSGSTYAVTVGTQPAGQTCTVTNDRGTATANVTNVSVNCTTNTYTIGGSVTGLASGQSVVLLNNAGNSTTVSADGSFTFSTAINSGSAYAVTIASQPVGQTCAVTMGSGTATANVTGVSVTCTTNTFTIGGSVTGLASGQSLTLLNNGGNSTTLNANGSFTFSTAINSGSAYAVTVGTQPTGQTCAVTTGSGTATANVTGVSVTCTTNPPTAIPTLSEWAMLLLASLLAMFAIRRIRPQ